MLTLTKEQQNAYDHFIKMRDKCKIVLTDKNYLNEHIPASEILACIDVLGLNHCLFIENNHYKAFVGAFMAWLEVEPRFRDKERLRASRGDYGGACDDWSYEPPEKEYKELGL